MALLSHSVCVGFGSGAGGIDRALLIWRALHLWSIGNLYNARESVNCFGYANSQTSHQQSPEEGK